MRNKEGGADAPFEVCLLDDGTVGALVDAGTAVYALAGVDHGHIVDLDGRLGANILTSSASNTILCLDLNGHCDTSNQLDHAIKSAYK
jgi:hypothetical protein